jgi:hypothetical protein
VPEEVTPRRFPNPALLYRATEALLDGSAGRTAPSTGLANPHCVVRWAAIRFAPSSANSTMVRLTNTTLNGPEEHQASKNPNAHASYRPFVTNDLKVA